MAATIQTARNPGLLERQSIKNMLWKSCMLALLTALALIFMLPIYCALIVAVKSLSEAYAFPPSLWVSEPRWSNFAQALDKLPFYLFIGNTLIICLAATTGQVLSGSMVGYAFARLNWKGRDFWFYILLATMMLPPQVLLIPHFLLHKNLGWINTYKPLILPAWLGGSAFFIFLFRQFFKGIPRELEEAARLDGASEWQIYWNIFLPNAKAVLATVAVMSFIAHWKDFMQPLIYLSDFEKYPISVGLRMYQSVEGSWINYLMAASIVALFPLVAIFIFAQRYFVQGMLLSGSKG